ncbi:MAG: transketolase [Candidatus Thermoplasmatota archaeon]|nr:transketolase [Candidatus Thermoplasmatota archaeon]
MDQDEALISELKEKARILRAHVLRMTHAAGSGHPGGSLSATDIIATLYFSVLRVDPENPRWPDRDRFILSKGHACPVLYAALAERGFFPVSELLTLRKLNSSLQGHPELGTTPGVEACAGAEGQGLSIAIGLALASRLDGKTHRIYVMIGDGENDVGQTWEAAMGASHFRLDHITAIIDRNEIQQEGRTEEIMTLEPLSEKWQSFGWNVLEIDGHDIGAILEALSAAREVREKPTVIIAHTVKGKGVSYMENVVRFHGTAPTDEELKTALEELGEAP